MTIGALLWIIAGLILIAFGIDILKGDVNWVVLAAGLCVLGYPWLAGPVVVKWPPS